MNDYQSLKVAYLENTGYKGRKGVENYAVNNLYTLVQPNLKTAQVVTEGGKKKLKFQLKFNSGAPCTASTLVRTDAEWNDWGGGSYDTTYYRGQKNMIQRCNNEKAGKDGCYINRDQYYDYTNKCKTVNGYWDCTAELNNTKNRIIFTYNFIRTVNVSSYPDNTAVGSPVYGSDQIFHPYIYPGVPSVSYIPGSRGSGNLFTFSCGLNWYPPSWSVGTASPNCNGLDQFWSIKSNGYGSGCMQRALRYTNEIVVPSTTNFLYTKLI